jgi:hypothetical protein
MTEQRDCDVPFDRISNTNGPAREHLCKYTAPPIRAEGGLQARRHFIHSFARRQLTSNRKPRLTDY